MNDDHVKPSLADIEVALGVGAQVEIAPNGDVTVGPKEAEPVPPLSMHKNLGGHY